jgi:polyisoprenyl-phosphate glycosyltransferase
LDNKKIISIVLSAYNEEGSIPELYKRLNDTTSKITTYKFEYLFINDCSTDNTQDIIDDLIKLDNRVSLVNFSKNCGSHHADAAGIDHCQGEVAILMACDLQDPPEIIPKLINEWEKGSQIVWAIREKRKGENFITLFLSRMYYYTTNILTNVKQPPSGTDAFLIDRIVIDTFKTIPEKNSSNIMLLAWLGFSQSKINYIKDARFAGESGWSISKKIKLTIDSLVSFSYVPIRFMTILGITNAIAGLIYGMFIFSNAINGVPAPGWSSLMIIILLSSGFQMIMIGIIGEYLWRTYDEARSRPRYVIKSKSIAKIKDH